MPEGMSLIERRIEQFETALDDMRQATSECHTMLKQLRDERRTIENLLKSNDLQKEVKARVEKIVDELDIWPALAVKVKAVLMEVYGEEPPENPSRGGPPH